MKKFTLFSLLFFIAAFCCITQLKADDNNDVTEVSTISDLRVSEQGETYKLTGEAILTYQQSFRGQKYIQDDTGGILIDDNDGIITTDYDVYDGITGIKGTLGEFGNMIQFVPEEDPGEPTSTGNEVDPLEISLKEFNDNFMDYQARLVTIKNVYFETPGEYFDGGDEHVIVDGDDENIVGDFRVTFYDVDYVGDKTPEGTFNMTGLPNSRSEGDFITSRHWDDMDINYNITFDIIDENEDPIQDAELAFMGDTIEEGPYEFEEVTPGSYDYTIAKEDFLTIEDEIILYTDTVIDIMLIEESEDMVTEFPWTEDFEDGDVPPATWSHYALGEGGWSISETPHTGDYAAQHAYTDEGEKADSWLVTPQIKIPEDERWALNFFENNASMGEYGYSGVRISTASGNPEHDDFVEVYESDENVDGYTEKKIDLTEYTGEVIYIAFVYQGEFAHDWWIDDITVEEDPIEEVETLAELREKPEDGTEYLYTGEAVITAMEDFGNQKFLQDETAAILIWDWDGIIETDYDLYDVITNVQGTINDYFDMIQLEPTANTPPADENNPIDPGIFTFDEVEMEDQAKFIKFENVIFTEVEVEDEDGDDIWVEIEEGDEFVNGKNYKISDGENEFFLKADFYDVDYIGEEIPTTPLNISGVIKYDWGELRIIPRFDADIVELETSTVTFIVEDPDEEVIEDAEVEIFGKVLITDAEGEANIELADGTYDYIVTAEGFEEISGSVNVEGEDITENVSMTVGIYDHETVDISIYPNPASNVFTISSDEQVIDQIRLINISGQLIKDIAVDAFNTQINVNDLPPGVYFMQIHTKESVITERVQISR